MLVFLRLPEQRLEGEETLFVQMSLRSLVPLPIVIDDTDLTQLAKLRINAVCLGVGDFLQSFPMVLAGQVGLVGVTCNADYTACFTDVDVVMKATVIIATTSGIQEGATDTNHEEPDR